jgi:hypothetical protein
MSSNQQSQEEIIGYIKADWMEGLKDVLVNEVLAEWDMI